MYSYFPALKARQMWLGGLGGGRGEMWDRYLSRNRLWLTGGLAWAMMYHVPHADYLNRPAAKINFPWTQEFIGCAWFALPTQQFLPGTNNSAFSSQDINRKNAWLIICIMAKIAEIWTLQKGCKAPLGQSCVD